MARDARELAEALRENPPALDDVARARMEKSLLTAARTVRPPVAPPKRSGRPFAAGLGSGLAVAAAVLLGWLYFDAAPSTSETGAVASFEAFAGDSPVRSGEFAEGEAVTTDEEQRVRAYFADRRVEVEVGPSSRTRFLRLDGNDLAVALDRGSVRVSFHPERRGERTLAIETPLARVEVVGTVFRVNVGSAGTRVSVEEGIVRVVPREGSERFVHAGESLQVAAPSTSSLAEPTERARVSVAEDVSLLAGRTEGVHDGVLHDGVLHDGVLHDGVLHDGAPHDGVPHDGLEAGEPGVGPRRLLAPHPVLTRSTRAAPGAAPDTDPASEGAEVVATTSAALLEETAEPTAEPTARRTQSHASEDLRFESSRCVTSTPPAASRTRHEFHAIVRTSGLTHPPRSRVDGYRVDLRAR
ncbi:MAG: FecR family protein [Polyangiales bacterium]